MSVSIEVKKTSGGPELWVAGVQVRTWIGTFHDQDAIALRDKMREAFKQNRGNWDDEPHAAEAWKRMIYVCDACHHTDKIWNARPHITPFGVTCPACNQIMNHKYFRSDTYEPDRRPRAGELIFIDLPPELALIYMHRRIEQTQEAGYKIPEGKTAESFARELALDALAEFGNHAPALMRLLT